MNDEEKQYHRCALCLINSAKTAINEGYFKRAARYIAATSRNLDALDTIQTVHRNAAPKGKAENGVEMKPVKKYQRPRDMQYRK